MPVLGDTGYQLDHVTTLHIEHGHHQTSIAYLDLRLSSLGAVKLTFRPLPVSAPVCAALPRSV